MDLNPSKCAIIGCPNKSNLKLETFKVNIQSQNIPTIQKFPHPHPKQNIHIPRHSPHPVTQLETTYTKSQPKKPNNKVNCYPPPQPTSNKELKS